MIVCPHCHKELPDDAVFCTYCGKSLIIDEKKEVKSDPKLKNNPLQNSFSKLGLLLFFVGLIAFDFVLATFLNATGGNTKWAFRISVVFYILSFVCGAISLLIDYSDKKKGYEPTGNKGFALVCMCLSFYVCLVNLTQGML